MYDVNQIARMLTEDPDIINELGPEGGVHPGGENTPGFSKQEGGGYTVVTMDRVTPSGKRILQDWPSLKRGVHQFYLPIYLVYKDGQPFVAGSKELRGVWYGPDDRPVDVTPEQAGVLTRLGVPENVLRRDDAQDMIYDPDLEYDDEDDDEEDDEEDEGGFFY